MNLADQYARALYEASRSDPSRNLEYLRNLQAALRRRGHEKLSVRIFASCEQLEYRETRRARRTAVTPAARRRRTLIELYTKLLNA